MGKWEHDDVERAKKVDETQKHPPTHTNSHKVRQVWIIIIE